MNISQETLDLLRASYGNPNAVPKMALEKAWVSPSGATTGINAYNLEAPAKRLYPVLTPLRNKIPRVTTGEGGVQANWRAITGVNTNNMLLGVSEGNRGGIINTTTKDYIAVFVELGLEDYVTWKAEYAAKGFQDLPAEATLGLLRSLMIGEENVILGGLGTYALTQTPQPACTPSNSGGSCTNAHSPYSVYCIALTLEGYQRSSVSAGVVQQISRINADGSADTVQGGSAQVSSAQTATIASGSSGSIACTVTAVPGAVAYAWYWGASGANVLLGAITTVNTYTITTDAATGTQNIANMDTASDHSQNSLEFDGLISQIAKTGSGSYIKSLDGATLTANGDGTISQLDTALKAFWDNYRLSPTTIWVNSQEETNITSKILSGSTTAAQRFVFMQEQNKLVGGTMAVSYYNKYAMGGVAKEIPIEIHPNLPPGTLLFETDVLPYPLSNVTNILQMKCRYDYIQIAWPMVKRRREYGIYFDGVLQNYFPPAFGIIYNIANG